VTIRAHKLIVLGLAVTALLASCNESPLRDIAATAPAQPVGVDSKPPLATETPARPSAEAEPAPATVTLRGSGKFLNENAATESVRTVAGTGQISLNFVDAEIKDVVATVLGTTLGLNYAVDPKIKGGMTLRTSRPIARNAVLPVLEDALRMSGAALVRTGNLYRVTPIEAAARGTTIPNIGRTSGQPGEAFGIQVVPLQHASAAEIAKVLEPLAPAGGILRTDTERNLLIVGGTSSERETMLEVVNMFDADWLSGMSFAIVPLQFAQPKDVLADLKKVFGSESDGPLAGLVRYYPIERRNAILLIASRPEYLDKARDWIGRLDVGDLDEERVYVYYVQNGRAADLAATLSRVFATGSGGAASSALLAPGLAPAQLRSRDRLDEPRFGSNFGGQPGGLTPMPSGTTGSRLFAQAVGPVLDAAQATPAQAPSVAGAPARGPAPSAGDGARTSSEVASLANESSVRIIADDVNNALVIKARPRMYRMIESALHKLDIVPLQVLIEATIAEVTLNRDLRYGVEWFFRAKKGSATNTFTLSNAADGAIASTFPGFSYLFKAGGDVQVVLDALKSVTDVNVISAPQLMVLDNRTAELQVGDQVPIATQSSISNITTNAPTVSQIQFRDTGVVLRVTPRVNPSGLVTLEIEQEVSDPVATTSSNIDSPTIRQRRIRSSVAVHTGETIALGGLIRQNTNNTRSGVPLLSDIPVLGNLFGATSDSTQRTELLVMITPRVVRNQEDARAVTDDVRRMLRDAAQLEHAKR